MKIKENFNQLLILIVYKLKYKEEGTKFLRQSPAKDATMELLLGKKIESSMSSRTREREFVGKANSISVMLPPSGIWGRDFKYKC